MSKWIKRFFGNLPFMEKFPCQANAEVDNTTYFCILNTGHIGPHKTYLGRTHWPWHWRSNEK